MPWCPKCKIEYEEGVLTCVDCDCELREDLASLESEWTNLAQGKSEDDLDELIQFLKYSNIEEVRCIEEEQSEGVILQVRQKQVEEAKKYVAVYLHQKKEEMKETLEDQEVPEELTTKVMPVTYEDKAQKLGDLKSSAFSFLTVGAIGFVFVLLVLFDVVELHIQPFYKKVFSVFFLLVTLGFMMIGWSAFRKIKSTAEEVNEILEQAREIKEWFVAQFTIEQIDQQIENIEGLAEENRYFERTSFIKEAISNEFLEADAGIIEGVAEELYEELYS